MMVRLLRHFLSIATVAVAVCATAAGSALAGQVQGMLPVPAVTIYPGDLVSGDMLTEKPFYFDPTRPLAVLDSAQPIIGKVAKRTLVAGKPIPNNSFSDPMLVSRGQPTVARFEADTLSITATVMPLQSGSLGAMVQARNIDSGQMITGMVQNDGSLLVGGGQ